MASVTNDYNHSNKNIIYETITISFAKIETCNMIEKYVNTVCLFYSRLVSYAPFDQFVMVRDTYVLYNWFALFSQHVC